MALGLASFLSNALCLLFFEPVLHQLLKAFSAIAKCSVENSGI